MIHFPSVRSFANAALGEDTSVRAKPSYIYLYVKTVRDFKYNKLTSFPHLLK